MYESLEEPSSHAYATQRRTHALCLAPYISFPRIKRQHRANPRNPAIDRKVTFRRATDTRDKGDLDRRLGPGIA